MAILQLIFCGVGVGGGDIARVNTEVALVSVACSGSCHLIVSELRRLHLSKLSHFRGRSRNLLDAARSTSWWLAGNKGK